MKKYRWIIFVSAIVLAAIVLFMVFSDHEITASKQEAATPPVVGKKEDYKSNWQQYVSAQLNTGYKTGFGGFKNLTLLMSNSLPYKVEHVRVKVDYIKAKGNVFKSETVDVYNLQPNDPKIVRAPDSNRGVRLQISIVGISCPDLQLSTF